MVTPDLRYHPPSQPEPMNAEAHFGTQRGFKAGIPDLHVTIGDQIAEGDKVVTLFVFPGTHKGEFHGLPPTGQLYRLRYEVSPGNGNNGRK